MSPRRLPVRATVRDLLADLLGRDVEIAPAGPQTLDQARPSYAATYVCDDGSVAAVAICDLALAAGTACAIGMATADDAAAAVARGGLSDDQRESLHEVVNVLAKVLNSPETPHVALRSVDAVPGDVPSDMAGVVLSPSARHDHDVAVDGFGSGTLTLIA